MKPLGKRGEGSAVEYSSNRTKLGGRDMSLTEDIDDTHGPTGPKQPSKPECNFFGVTRTFRAPLLLWPLGLSAGVAPNLPDLKLRGDRLAW